MNLNRFLLGFAHEPQKLIPILIFLCTAILLSAQLFQIFKSESDMSESHLSTKVKNKQITINAQSPLFTIPIFGPYVPNLSDLEIKQSSLDLEIVGIMFSPNKKGSQVLIRAGGGIEEAYFIGDKLPGGAIIKQINKNGIVVFYNDALENLSLPKNELLFEEPAKPLIEE